MLQQPPSYPSEPELSGSEQHEHQYEVEMSNYVIEEKDIAQNDREMTQQIEDDGNVRNRLLSRSSHQPPNHRQTSSTSTTALDLNRKKELEAHEKVLTESKKSVLWFMFCALFTAFLRSSRTNVWILYARVFYTETSSNIAWVLYGGTMFSGISALFYSSVADYVGYDKMMLIILFLKCIGVLLECIGIDFSLLIIGYFLTALAILYVCLSYISWILPHKYAVQYTSYFYAAYFLSYLSGAMIGSILSYYFNYRLIFWVNFGFMISIIIFSFYFILGVQKRLEKKQLRFKKLYKTIRIQLNEHKHQQNTFENRNREETNISNREYRLVPHNDEEEVDAEPEEDPDNAVYGEFEKLSDINERFSVVVNDSSNRQKLSTSYFGMRSMTWTHWILLISIMLQHAMVLCVDALWILYYNVYIVDKFHSSIVIGASQIVVVCIFFAVGNLSIPHILTANYCQIQDNKYLVILFCSILLIGMFGIAYPLTNDLNVYWAYSVITGFVSGILSMTMEIIILELQPKEYTGRINGIKGFTRFFVTANGVLIAGLLWNVTYDSMFYTQGL